MFNDGTTIPENAMTNSMYQSCIQACWTCAQACERMAA
ncbi:four-helix bundle copper-binding protein [Thalassolituus pacificus]